MPDEQFEGGVFSAAIEGGRAGARLSLGHDGVHAETSEGQRFRVSYAECRLERGGASGKMWFCRTPDRSLTLFSEAPGFAAALRERGRRELSGAFEQIDGESSVLRRRAAGTWLSVLLLLAAALTLGFFGIRYAGRAAIELLPTSIDEKLGALALSSMSLEGRVVDDPLLEGAVKTIVDRLAAQRKQPFKFRVQVVDAPVLNAFALPGGYIVVYTGLLRAAASPEQLAGVLAHEMAHVTRRHGMHRIAQSVGVIAAIQLLFGDVSGLAAVAVEVLREGAINSYSRDQEREADLDAVATLASAGIAPRALADFFALLARREPSLPDVVSWLGTHPDLQQRIREVQAAAAQRKPKTRAPIALNWPEIQRRAGALTPTGAK